MSTLTVCKLTNLLSPVERRIFSYSPTNQNIMSTSKTGYLTSSTSTSSSLVGRVSASSTGTLENEVTYLKEKLKRLESDYPIPITQSSLNILPGNRLSARLDSLCLELSMPFSFVPEVRSFIDKTFGQYTEIVPAWNFSAEDKAKACNQLLDILLPKVKEILAGDLLVLWRAILDANCDKDWWDDDEPYLFNVREIREWMEKYSQYLNKIETLDLSGSEIEILPIEINNLQNLKLLNLEDTNIAHYSAFIQQHPNRKGTIKKLEVKYKESNFRYFANPLPKEISQK